MSLLLRAVHRLLIVLLLLLLVSFLTFIALSASQVAEGRFTWGAVAESYGAYLGAITQGNWGTAQRGEPVTHLLLRTFFKSMGTLSLAMAVASVTGLGVGLIGRWRAGTGPNWALALSVLLLSAPSFLIGGLMQYLDVEAATRLQMLPLPTTGFGWDRHLIMPVLVLAAKPAAYLARITAQSVEETLSQPHVRVAYAKGLTHRLVLLKHGLRTSSSSIIAALALSLRLSVGMLPIVETVFVCPGMGFAFLLAIRSHDLEAASGLAMSFAVVLWLLNAALEWARQRLDPRLGHRNRLGEV